MKKFMFLFVLVFVGFNAMAKMIHPMDFDGSETQKAAVIQFIKESVHHDYCEKIDMCTEQVLRMMEQENLNSFKAATQATDRKIMDRVIKDYCQSGIDMCNYQIIWMMYQENEKASQQQLSW